MALSVIQRPDANLYVNDPPQYQEQPYYYSRWSAAFLPLVYKISNTKFPTNTEDAVDTYTAVTNNNGFAKFDLAGTAYQTYIRGEKVTINGTVYSGVYEVIAIQGDQLTLNVAFSETDTGTANKYYDNYATLVRLYAGVPAYHPYAAQDPMTLIGTFSIAPNLSNIAVIDVADLVRQKISKDNDLSASGRPNDLDAWTCFYIEYAETYDTYAGGIPETVITNFTVDNLQGITPISITNGSFTSSLTGWSQIIGKGPLEWVWDSGSAKYTGDGFRFSKTLYQEVNFKKSIAYKIVINYEIDTAIDFELINGIFNVYASNLPQGSDADLIYTKSVYDDFSETKTIYFTPDKDVKYIGINGIVVYDKTIEINSEDIANGYLTGKFSFDEIVQVSQNALGSIYNNYEPYKVTSNQYLDFNFTIYNQIVTVFFPEVSIDNNTKIKGKIQSNKNQLKLTISSPKIDAYGNELKDVLLRTDNQNPLYNSHLTASKVQTKYYNVSELNLLSLYQNDTLYFKSVFTGGDKKNEDFNLDFFYTLNSVGKSVIGFDTSSFKFKDNIWNLSPNESIPNKITFDLKENEFNFSKFKLVSGAQKIAFKGSLEADVNKEFLINFTKVKLQSFLPIIDSLALKGSLSGSIDLVQKKGVYNPKALLTINDFDVNGFNQGDLSLSLKGDNSFEKYAVDLSIDNRKVKSIEATGFLDFSEKRPLIDLEVYLEEFGLDAFSPLGKDVLSSIRGTASGNFSLSGFIGNPEMDGALKLKNAGF